MKMIGFYDNDKIYHFDQSDKYFTNLNDGRVTCTWQMCEHNFINSHEMNYAQLINNVFDKYKQYDPNLKLDATGKILIFDIFISMFDCLAFEETSGFYDESDCPPPEFWIGHIDQKIISYIPENYIDLADLGVEISMSESLRWANVIYK